MIKENQIIFTYLHLAAAKKLTEGLVKSKSVCIAYETVTDNNGKFTIISTNERCSRKNVNSSWSTFFGKNIKKEEEYYWEELLGVDPATVVILGGGVVGENAALIATGMKSKVYIIDKSSQRLEQLKEFLENNYSSTK